MAKPYYFILDNGKLVAHADDGKCLTVQQAHPLEGGRPDSLIFLERDDCARLRDALTEYLEATA